MKQTILVTGGTGFIGSHTSVELIEAGYDVVIVDNLSNSKIEVLDGIEKITGVRPAFEQVDLRDREATENVFRKYPKIEGIIHFAASKAVGESVQKPLLSSQVPVLSTDNPSQRTSLSQRMHLIRKPHHPMGTQRKSTSRLSWTIFTAEPTSRALSFDTSILSVPIRPH